MTNLYQSGAMVKHVGAYAGRRVVLLQPDTSDFNYVFIIESERLPHSLEDFIMKEVESNQAQQQSSVWFGDVLNARQYEGINALSFLFQTKGAIARAEMKQVLMIPLPGRQIKLSDVYEAMVVGDRRLADSYRAWKNPDVTQVQRVTSADVIGETTPTRPLTESAEARPADISEHNTRVESNEQKRGIARSLLMQAQMLQADATSKFEEAYTIDPSLRPAGQKAPIVETEGAFIDQVTGKIYKTESALKGAITKRESATK